MIDYRDKYNTYMEKNFKEITRIEEELKIFFPNFKEKMNEYVTKIYSKINEYEESFKINISRELIISYINIKKSKANISQDLINGNNFEKKTLENLFNPNSNIIINTNNENEKKINFSNNIVNCKIIYSGFREEEKSSDTKKSD